MIGKTVLRVVVGGLFAGHGAQKLFGAFGGRGLDGTGQAFESMGLTPGKPMAATAGASEFAGGTLLALGAATPLSTAMLSGVMASAIERVHLKNGPWASDGGYEYPLVLMAVLWYLADEGPGPISIDRLRRKSHHGPGWAFAQLAAGVGGAMAIKAISARQQRQEQWFASPAEYQDGGTSTAMTTGQVPAPGASPGGSRPSAPGRDFEPQPPMAPDQVGARPVGNEATSASTRPAEGPSVRVAEGPSVRVAERPSARPAEAASAKPPRQAEASSGANPAATSATSGDRPGGPPPAVS